MKTKAIKIMCMMILIVLGLSIVTAIPKAPEQYWGYVYVEGSLVPAGTKLTVESYDTGEVFVNQTLPYSSGSPGSYFFNLQFDDPLTTEDEGASIDEELRFKINGISTITPSPGSDTAEVGDVNNNLTILGILNPTLTSKVSYSATTTDINEEITITFLLNNTGSGSANTTTASISDDDLEITGLPATLMVAKENTNSTTITIEPSACGSYSKTLSTNYYNLAGTLIGSISTSIRFTVKGYDIEVASVDESATSVTEGGLVNITVTIDNEGDYNISSYTLKLYDNDVLFKTESVTSDLDVDEYVKKTYSLNLSVGDHKIKAKVLFDEDECSIEDNEATSSTITVEEKVVIDEAAIAVEKKGNEILARIRLDKSRLDNNLSVSFIQEDVQAKIVELNGYEETTLDIQGSGISSKEKNKTFIVIEGKLDTLEQESVYNLREIKANEYDVNSTFIDYLAYRYSNVSFVDDIVDLFNKSKITVNVKILEAEYLSYGKFNLTRVEIKVTTELDNVVLAAIIPEEISEEDLIYEVEPEMLKESAIVWNTSSPIVYYSNEDIFQNAEGINYVLMPKENTEESLPMIQGFAAFQLEEEEKSDLKNIVIIFLILAVIIGLFVYRNKIWQLSQKIERPKPQHKNLFKKPRKTEGYKGCKRKITLAELYSRLGSTEEVKVRSKAKTAKVKTQPDPEIVIINTKHIDEEDVDEYVVVEDNRQPKKARPVQPPMKKIQCQVVLENLNGVYGNFSDGRPKVVYKRRYELILERFKKKRNVSKRKDILDKMKEVYRE